MKLWPKLAACTMDAKETSAIKAVDAATPWIKHGDICALAIPLNQEDMALAHTGTYCPLI